MFAVIFDLDGTLIESQVDIKGMKECLLDYIYNLGVERGSLTPRNTTVEMVSKTLSYLDKIGASENHVRKVVEDLGKIMDRFEMKNIELTEPMDGAFETLKRLKDLGLKIGILTRGCEAYTRRSLEVTKMLGFIDAIETRRDLLLAKPNPVSISNLCCDLKISPERALLVGDHPLDVDCALRSGVEIVGVSSLPSRVKALKDRGCPIILNNLWELVPFVKRRLEDLL